jgi:hypothetical protein
VGSSTALEYKWYVVPWIPDLCPPARLNIQVYRYAIDSRYRRQRWHATLHSFELRVPHLPPLHAGHDLFAHSLPTDPDMSADFWAGYVSGAAGIIIGNPLDLVKTRLQAGKTTSNPESGVTPPRPQTFRSHFDHAGTLVRGEWYTSVMLTGLPSYVYNN